MNNLDKLLDTDFNTEEAHGLPDGYEDWSNFHTALKVQLKALILKTCEEDKVIISKFDAYAFYGMIKAILKYHKIGTDAFIQLVSNENIKPLKQMKKDLEKSLNKDRP